MSRGTRVTIGRWFVLATSTTASLLVGVVMCVFAPAAVGAQEPDSISGPGLVQDSSTVENQQALDLLFGARVGIRGGMSPGASVQATWDGPVWNGPASLSLQLLAHSTLGYKRRRSARRSEVRTDFLVGRLKLGIGRGDGASVFAFVENGEGTNIWRGGMEDGWRDTYDLEGIGLGLGFTGGRVTTSTEFVFGGHTEGDYGIYWTFGFELQTRLWRVPL